MRAYLLLILLCLLVMVPAVHAAELKQWNIDISLEDDKTSVWSVTLIYDQNITKSDYYVLARLTGVEVVTDGKFIDCPVSNPGLGTSIVCDNIWASKIEYRFRAHGLVNSLQDLDVFNYRFPISQNTDNYSLIISLPLGTGLVETTKLEGTGLERFEPVWGSEGSDGRRIFLEWKLDDPDLGRSLDVSVVYERIVGDQLLVVATVALITIITVAFLFFTRRKLLRI